MSNLPSGFTFVQGSNTSGGTTTPETEQDNNLLPSGFRPVLDDDPVKEPTQQKILQSVPEYVPGEERIETTREEIPTETTSLKSLIEDDDLVADILQYRQDRFGTPKDTKAASILFGRAFGMGQELTNENVVDDLMDHYRFITQNSMEAGMEISWLRSIEQKEK